jgi:hypothetical protein
MKKGPATIAFGLAVLVVLYSGWRLYLEVVHPTALKWKLLAIVLTSINVGIAIRTFAILVKKQDHAAAEDEEHEQALAEVMQSLDRDGDGEVSRNELKRVFGQLFPGMSFDEVWAQLDRDKSGTITIAELANHFGMGHLVNDREQQVDASAYLDEDQFDTADVEAKLGAMASSKLSQSAGGALAGFLVWDVASVVIAFGFVGFMFVSESMSLDDWRFRTSLYFAKMVIGLLSLPFLVFRLPFIKQALTQTRVTAYDQSGECIPKLPAVEIHRRFDANKAARQKRIADGNESLYDVFEDKWDAYLSRGRQVDIVEVKADNKMGGLQLGVRKRVKAPPEPDAGLL